MWAEAAAPIVATTTQQPMTYILDIGLWHVGPFATHIAAQHWAETHGVDTYKLIPLDDPAEAPPRIHRHREQVA